MKKRMLALVLCVALLLTGCGVVDIGGYFRGLKQFFTGYVAFEDMNYVRPDMDLFHENLQSLYDFMPGAEDADKLMEEIWAVYEVYYDFCTNYALSNIHYSKDVTDIYWQEEYRFCMEQTSEISAAMDQLLYDLADHPLREELEQEDFFGENFFDDYEGESLWDEEFTRLMGEETALQSRYYALSSMGGEEEEYYSESFFNGTGRELRELYAQLVALRQDIARYAGYEDYAGFAYDFYYGRDYTPAQVDGYLEQIAQKLTPLYRTVAAGDIWNSTIKPCTENAAFAYTKSAAAAMGGRVKEAFDLLEKAGLYDISYGENKFDASFTVFLPSFGQPYIFVDPSGGTYDKLTFTHEFGHFCNDYAAYGGSGDIDVAEIFSQGMEYLSLCCGDEAGALEKLKLADGLSVYVEQAAYACFEQRVYALEKEELTDETICDLFARTEAEFGLDTWRGDSRSFVYIPHLFISPMYIISYVVSNDAALQLYQMEKQTAGAGLAVYEANLDTRAEGLLAFLAGAGLESPFAPGRIDAVLADLEKSLK